MQCLLLSADTYELTNENTGELLNGTTMFFLNDYREDSRQSLGIKPTKISASIDVFKSLFDQKVKLPAIVDMDFVTKPGAGGKATLAVTAVKFVKEVKELF